MTDRESHANSDYTRCSKAPKPALPARTTLPVRLSRTLREEETFEAPLGGRTEGTDNVRRYDRIVRYEYPLYELRSNRLKARTVIITLAQSRDDQPFACHGGRWS